jgi:hypothetical protein
MLKNEIKKNQLEKAAQKKITLVNMSYSVKLTTKAMILR